MLMVRGPRQSRHGHMDRRQMTQKHTAEGSTVDHPPHNSGTDNRRTVVSSEVATEATVRWPELRGLCLRMTAESCAVGYGDGSGWGGVWQLHRNGG